MKKTLLIGLISAASLLPFTASAQDRGHRGQEARTERGQNSNQQGERPRRTAPAGQPAREARPTVRSYTPPASTARPSNVQAPRRDDARGQQQRTPQFGNPQDRRPQAQPQGTPRPAYRPEQRQDRQDYRTDRRAGGNGNTVRPGNYGGQAYNGQTRADPRRDDRRPGADGRQDYRGGRNDARQDYRSDHRGDRYRQNYSGRHYGDWRDNDRYRQGWNDNRRWNSSWRNDNRYDWQHYRSYNRNAYRLPRYYAPRGYGYGYNRFSIGLTIGSILFAPQYWISDPYSYRLPPAYGPYRWVRYYDDALLIDIRSGYVVDTAYGIFW